MKRIGFSLIVILLFISGLSAQIIEPVKWKTYSIQTGSNTFDLIFSAKMDENWNIYSQYLDSDDGPVRTSFEYTQLTNVSLEGKNEECGVRKEGYDKLFDMNVVKYAKYAHFVQSVKTDGNAESVEGYLTFMTCDDKQCLPPTDVDFSFDLSAAANAEEIGYTRADLCNASFDIIRAASGSLNKDKPVEENIAVTEDDADVEMDEGTIAESVASDASITNEDGILTPVEWTFDISGANTLVITANIADGWHIYAQELESEDGPIPTTFQFENDKELGITYPLEEEVEKRVSGYDQYFDMDVTKFKQSATFTTTVDADDPQQDIVGFLNFMACTNEKCLPPTYVDFVFNLANGTAREKAVDDMALTSPDAMEDDELRAAGTPVAESFNYDQAEIDCTSNQLINENKTNIWLIFIAGFLGGLVALLTPCVFPMIPITVGFFTKSSSDRASGIKNALIYGASIIVIYVTIGLLITSIFGADALNLLSTNAVFNIFFFALFIIFAISFFGYFELTLPSSWSTKTDQIADKGGLIGIFFMAFTLALVSFSCTGPIIGTLLVETATGTGQAIFGRIPLGPLVGMFGFSVALALPFALFAAFPGWLQSMPRSGGWMNDVKVTLGFVEVALAFKFLSVADLTMGWKILPYELFLAVWILCALGLAAYYLGILKFPHYSKRKKFSPVIVGLSILMLGFAGYLATGFKYDPVAETFSTPSVMSGLAPPAGHSYIHPNSCPLNLDCYKDYYTAKEYARERGKPLLVDFTGHGCVNCRKMEDNVWGEEGVYDLIKEEYVLVSLYVDERKKLEEPYTSVFDGKEKRTVGNKWADFQAIHFNRNSQPFYVLVDPRDGSVLNKPVAYTPDKEKYEEFLQCGVDRFNSDLSSLEE